MKVSYTHELPMGHRLQYHEGKCRFLHGHNYEVTVLLDGSPSLRTGMVIDFSALKKAVRKVLDRYDHAFVLQDNDPAGESVKPWSQLILKPFPPTAESLALCWKEEIAGELHEPQNRVRIEVRETRDCCVSTV